MKKRSSKKLTLTKQTVRKLSDGELGRVVGGTGTGTLLCNFSRASGCCPCTGTSNPPTSPTMCPIK